jgi:hypothetical protein
MSRDQVFGPSPIVELKKAVESGKRFAEEFAKIMEEEKAAKKPYFKLPPELADGEHWVPMDNIDTILEYVKEWCKDCKSCVGESFTIEVIEMTDAEIEALPDI